ncbi:hypothetical protein [Streptodolium elevatio]|uniref:Uncharacterized protein n=1 Tax=Streptodolium elevatio TaxID=3157996 RepID=A0ABV3DH40_9ACTN
MARPADWSALGLSSDPTPGDPDRIDRVIAAELVYINLATTIDSGLTEVKNTSSAIFVGKTADALRGVIDGRLRDYISTYKKAHEDVRGALVTYVAAMREQQARADAALTAAQALAEDDDTGREAQKTIAENAKEALENASTAAEGVIDTAAESIASPVDECEEFWKALTWIAIILIVPAIIFGGPIALLAIGLNVALLIKTAIDFAHGNAGVTELVLAVLGVIAPTTKGLHLGNLWNVIKTLTGRGIIGTKNLFLGGANSLGLFVRTGLGIDNVVGAAGSWIKGGIQGLKLGPVFTTIPELARFGGTFNGIRFFPLGAELTVINLAGAKMFFGLRSIATAINAVKGLGGMVVNGLSGAKSLRLFLPVAADEMGKGLGLAFRIGFIDRGIFGMYRYGAFANGQFLGAGSKISGGVGAGLGAFGPGNELANLGKINVEGMGAVHLGSFNSSFGIPPMNNQFTNAFSDFSTVNIPNLGAFNGGFNLGNFPPLGTHLGNAGNLGAVVPFSSFGAKFADMPMLSLNNLGLTNIAGSLGSTPSVNGLGAGGLGALPATLGHISIPNLNTVTHGVNKVDLSMPASPHLITDMPSTGAISPANIEALHGVNLPQLGNIGTPQLSTTAMPHMNLPDVQATPVANLNGSLTPSLGHNAGGVQTPALGSIQLPAVDARLVDVPSLTTNNLGGPANLGLGDNATVNVNGITAMPVNSHVAMPDVGALPGVGHTVTPNLGAVGTPGQVPTPGITALGNVVHVNAASHSVVPHSPSANIETPNAGGIHGAGGLDTADLSAHTPAAHGNGDTTVVGLGGRTGDVDITANTHIDVQGSQVMFGNVSTSAADPGARNLQVFALTHIEYDLAHTFDSIPGLAGVEVRVFPSMHNGQTLDVDIQPVSVRTDVTATPMTVGDRHILRIEQALGNGSVHRWDFELNAQNNHQLLKDEIVDGQGTGPVSGPDNESALTHIPGLDRDPLLSHYDELYELTTPAPGSTNVTVHMMAAGNVPPPPPPPTPHFVNLPNLPGGRMEVLVAHDGGIAGIRSVGVSGAPPAPNLNTRHFTGPGGNVVQVDQTVVANVEIRRWNITMGAAGGQITDIQRIFRLNGGPHNGSIVTVDVNAHDVPTGVRHTAGGTPVPHPGGRAVDFDTAGIVVPSPTGFHLYDTGTGLPSGTGLQLVDSAGHGTPLHILTPTGGGASTVVSANAVHNLGTVTTPASTNGQFHVVPNGTGPTVRVFDSTGHFSHNSLPLTNLDGLGVPGGHIRDPHGANPQLAGRDGTPVPVTSVTPQLHNDFRIQHAGGQFHVDAAGNRLHDVVPLNGGNGAGQYVFTPAAGGDPLPATRDFQGNTTGPTVARVDNTFHVNTGQPNNVLDVHTPNGAFSHQAVPITGGGGAPGGFIRLPDAANPAPLLTRGNGNAIPHTTVTPQTGGGYLVQHPGGNIVVTSGGVRTHDVTVPIGRNGTPVGYVHTPVGPAAVPNANPTDVRGNVNGNLTVGTVTTDIRLTRADGSYTQHAPGGGFRFEAVRIQAGPFAGDFIRVDATSVRMGSGPNLTNIRNSTAVEQIGMPGGGFRVERGAAGHMVVNPNGMPHFDVTGLRGADGRPINQFVFTTSAHAPVGTAVQPASLHGPNGAPLGAVNFAVRPDGSFQLTTAAHISVHAADGAFDFRVLRLTDGVGAHLGQNIRVHPGGLHQLVDGNFTAVPHTTISSRPGGGHHIQGQNGEFRLFNGAGQLDFQATSVGVPNTHLGVTNGAGVHQFTIIRLSDGQINNPAQIQFIDNAAGGLRALDGNLNVLPNPVTLRPGGGYQIDGVGLQAGEFRRFDGAGRLEMQRVNIFRGDGQLNPSRYFEINHPAGGSATWTMVKLDMMGQPIARVGASKWFEGGAVDMAGSGAGRVHLVSHTGTTVFERRLLPGNGFLDAHHSTGSLGEFSHVNQRGTWTQFGANGNLVAFGTRHWGESTRSYFDVRSFMGTPIRVRHFQASADGGHVLANLNHHPFTQSLADSQWVRFDADFQPIATGNRAWGGGGPGRGFTDTMHHPVTGTIVKVQEKFGRFQTSLHGFRRFDQIEMGADGIPKRSFVSRHPDGNVNGFGKTLANGDFLVFQRFAEQRPPVAFRNLFSSDLRNTDLSRVPWLRDSTFRVGTWVQETAGGGSLRGSHFIANNKATFDVASTGDIVRETRNLSIGRTLTVGDVLPPINTTTGVRANPVANHLPWSEGDGGLSGHRLTAGPFTNVPGMGTRTIAWQDRYTTNLGDGDWYTPNAGKQWHVIRTGFTDGTYLDFRPTPQVRPDGTAGNSLAQYRGTVNMNSGNWTMYNPHGVVVARTDQFPNPTGAGTIDVIGRMGPNPKTFTWHVGGNSGVRTTAFERQITPWHWDRESFQDFDGGRLIRDHRQLGGGSVFAWRGNVTPAGAETWHWNKVDAHGNILDFGGNVNNRVRHWFDANGTQLTRWEPGARWSDQLANLGNRVIQEIPAPKPPAGSIQAWFTDKPFRVREYGVDVNSTNSPFNPHVWQESDQGIISRQKFQLPDGTFLETDAFNKQARRYDVNGITPINDRPISGYISEYNADGSSFHIGRETHFTGVLNEYRGLNRTFREINRWEFGPSIGGEAVDTPFALRAFQSLGIDMAHEVVLDFVVNLAVTAAVKVMTGTAWEATDFARAAYGAVLSALNKGVISGAHMVANRGGWKVYFSNIDYGQPGSWRPNDDSWNTEWGATERPTRWRGGTYEFGLGLGTGMIANFVSGSSQAAIFGGRALDGSLVRFTPGGAAYLGLSSTASGVLNGISIGALRALVQHSIGSRVVHRQGLGDIFVVGGIGKLAEKLFNLRLITPAVRDWMNASDDVFIIPTGDL